jgi:hypothetical protein
MSDGRDADKESAVESAILIGSGLATYTKATELGTTTESIRLRYRSENHPEATVQNPAKMYGGALSA